MFQFPASPIVNQTFTPIAGVTYTWNGTGWMLTNGFVTRTQADGLYIPLTSAGQPNGVATLDSGGLVPLAQLPTTVPSPQITVRQTVRVGKTDSNGYASMLAAGSGLALDLDGATSPIVVDFANYDTDLTSKVSSSISNFVTALAASNTSFVHATYSSATAVTGGQTLVPPQYGYAFDRAQGALLSCEGTNGATTTTDDWGNTWTLTGATITTAQFKFGASSLDCTGGSKYAATTGITTFGDGSWEMSLWFRINVLPGSGISAVLFSAGLGTNFGVFFSLGNVAGTTKLTLYLSSTGTSWDIVSGVTGTNTTWTLSQWNRVRLVFDALAGTYRAYLSLNGAAETQDITVSSTARICAFTGIRLGADQAAGSTFNGWFDAFRFIRAATVTTTQTPSASAPTITDYPVHWFSIPQMRMYEVTGASASAGSNPTMTQRSRVFLCEADTSGAAVTAVRNYALRGQYTSDDFAYTVPSQAIRSHNIGVRPKYFHAYLVVMTAEGGNVNYPVGQVMSFNSHFDGSLERGGEISVSRNGVTMSVGINATRFSNYTGGVSQGVAQANYRIRLEVNRGW